MPMDIPAPAPIDIPTGILLKTTPSDIPSPVPTDKPQLSINIGMFLFLPTFEFESILFPQFKIIPIIDYKPNATISG